MSLEVGRGEVVGLIGRNGVGKSTTLKTIMGLVNASAGRIVYDGRPVSGLPSYKLARIGIAYVPEDRRIFKLLTVMENLRTGLDRAWRLGGAQERAAGEDVCLLPASGRASQLRPAARSRVASSRCWPSVVP